MEKINYEIDWKDAPEWAFAHAYDHDGEGYFFGMYALPYTFCPDFKESGYEICSNLLHIHEKNWKKSMTFRPTINK